MVHAIVTFGSVNSANAILDRVAWATTPLRRYVALRLSEGGQRVGRVECTCDRQRVTGDCGLVPMPLAFHTDSRIVADRIDDARLVVRSNIFNNQDVM